MSEPAVKYSLVIPTFNETRLGYLERNLKEHSQSGDTEIICVDGGSTDQTPETIKDFGAQFWVLPNSNRAQRINLGLQKAKGDWIVVIHPRNFLGKTALHELEGFTGSTLSWGAWTHAFDLAHPLLKFTSWYSNSVRGDQRSIYYLDHCFFIHRSAFAKLSQPLFPELDIFEDTEVWLKLRKIAKGTRLPARTITSAIRFKKTGIFRQALRNQLVKLQYLLGQKDAVVNARYEKNLSLNGQTSIGEAQKPEL